MTPSHVASPRLPWRTAVILAVLLFGIAVVENISYQLLPLTLRRFTDNAFVIGLVLALNPLFGFLVQPFVAMWSDRLWTPLGRRAVILIGAAPLIALCLFLLPLAPEFLHVVLLVVVYQFFHDFLWSVDNPLLTEMVPSQHRARVAAMLSIASIVALILVTRFGLAAVQSHETENSGRHFGLPLYWAGAAAMLFCIALPACFLREQRESSTPVHAPIGLVRYLAEIRNEPGILRMGLVNFLRGFHTISVTGFLVLFATGTLAQPKDRYGEVVGIIAVMGLGFAWLAGEIAGRWPRNRVLSAGFAVSVVAYAVGWTSAGITGLAVAVAIKQFADCVTEVAFKSFVTEFYPRGRVGQFNSAINLFFAVGRTLALALVGKVIEFSDGDYRMIWPMGLVVALSGAALALGVRDRRIPHPIGTAVPSGV